MTAAGAPVSAGTRPTLPAGAVPWLPPRDVLLLILAATLVRAMVAACTGLTDDEAYYRLWALAPARSYLDHPPMVGWLIAIGRGLLGDTALGVRLMAVLLPALGTLVLWRTAHLLFDATVARRAVWVSLAMPVLGVGGIIITPDTPSVMFWGLAAWALAELAVSGVALWWLAVGAFAGLGLLSKYTNLFAGAGILLWLLLPANRAWFARWQVWAGGGLALLLATPVVAWNMEHGGASFAKQFGRVAAGQGLTLKFLGEMVGGWIGLASPVIATFAAFGAVWAARAAWAARGGTGAQGEKLLIIGLLPLLAFMLWQSLGSRVQPNWLGPLYPNFALLAALALGQVRGAMAAHPRLGRLVPWALPVGLGLTGLIYAHALLPVVVMPGARDPTSQMRGWENFAADLEVLRRTEGAAWIATDGYAMTGQLAWHLDQGSSEGPAVIQLTERLRYVHLPPPDPAVLQQPALFVTRARDARPAWLATRFRRVRELQIEDRHYRGVSLGSYRVWLVAEPIVPALAPLNASPGRLTP